MCDELKMYSLPNSRVHELRETFVKVTLTDGDNNLLTMALASLCRDNSVLGIYNIFTPHLHLYLLCIYTSFTLYLHLPLITLN